MEHRRRPDGSQVQVAERLDDPAWDVAKIILSRADPRLVEKLFELVVHGELLYFAALLFKAQ